MSGGSMSADCFVEAPLVEQLVLVGSRRGRRLEVPVRERSDASQNHGAEARVCEKLGNQADRSAGRHIAVGVETVVEIGVLGIPEASVRQIQVPRQDGPFTAPARVAIDVPILAVHIDVPDHRIGRQHVHAPGKIDVVVEVPLQRRTGEIQPVDERLEVAVVLGLARLLLHPGRRRVSRILVEQVRVDFVERAVPVEARPFEVGLVRILHQVGGAEELPVLLNPHREGEVRGDPRPSHDLVPQHVPHLRFVGPIRQEIDVGHPRGIGAPAETVAPIEIDVVALLGEAGRGLAVHGEVDVVVEFAVIESRASNPALGPGPRHIGREPVKHRQRRQDPVIQRDGAEVLIRVEPRPIGRLLRRGALRIRRDEPPARHFAGGEGRAGNDRRPEAITRPGIGSCPVIHHRQLGFPREHPSVEKPDRRDRAAKGGHPRDDRPGTRGLLGGIGLQRLDDWPRSDTNAIGRARRRRGEKTPGPRHARLRQSERDILELRRVHPAHAADDRHAVGRHQLEGLPRRREGEVRVQPARRIRAVLSRGENHEVSTRVDGDFGKPPVARVRRVVGQVIARERDGGGVRIVDLHPVRELAVLVLQSGIVGRQKLGENRGSPTRLGEESEQPPRRQFPNQQRD